MTRFRTIGLSAFAAVLLVGSASAQDRGGGFLEKLFGPSDRFAEPQGSAPGPGDDRSSQGAPGAQNRVPGDAASRFERLEATIRQLTGEIEQLQHRNQQLEAELRRIQGDPEYRSQSPSAGVRTQAPARPAATVATSQSPVGATPGRRGDAFDPSLNPTAPGAPRPLGTTAPSAPLTQGPGADEQTGVPAGRQAGAPLDLSTMSGDGTAAGELPAPPARNLSGTGAQVATLPPTDNPKDNFDLAYGYLLRKDYALAEDGFRGFLRRFPSDRLAPDAQYWLGESLFQRQKYRDAAETFLNVSTKYETAAKAPDALLRLGQALSALGEKEAACASFNEVLRKYPRASVSLKQGVDREQKRAHC
jgi:tol-pal system protein YbgF